MKFLKFFLLINLILLSTTNILCFNPDNPPNPLDAKSILLTIINRTDISIKVSFIVDKKEQFYTTILPRKNYTFNIPGRFNKINSYFSFSGIEDSEKSILPIRVYYRRIAKITKTLYIIDMLTENGKVLISTTKTPTPFSTVAETTFT